MFENRALFFFDYVDPSSWAVELWLAELGAPHGVVIDRRPYEVRPPPQDLLDPADPAWTASRELARPTIEAAGMWLASPALIPWTRKAHELAFLASEKGCLAAVHSAIFEAFHADGSDIGRVDVLVDLAVAAGLDPAESKAVLDVDRFTDDVERARREAGRLDVDTVPTVLAGQMRLERPRGIDELRTFLTSLGGAD